jgi:hypothetical protein
MLRVLLLTTIAIQWSVAIPLSAGEKSKPGDSYDPPASHPEQVEHLERSSDFFAAFLVAYEADRAWFKESAKVDLDPKEFVRRHKDVFISKLSDGTFEVHMGPESVQHDQRGLPRIVGPGRRYIVDGTTFQLREGSFDR